MISLRSRCDGEISITENQSAIGVDLSSLVTAGGAISIGGNTNADLIDLASLVSISGALDISGQPRCCQAINAVRFGAVGGDITIASNAPDANVNLNSLTNYGCGSNEVTMTLDGGTFALTNGLTLCTNATLAGSSTVDGSVTNKGTIEPGNSPGRMNITGSLVLASTSGSRWKSAAPRRASSISSP